jgi:prepilin-type N-terminal cleavage/methylation domain-containing protein
MGHQNKKTGFTIVELLIVVVVIAILAAISIVAYNGIQQRARVSNLQNSLSSGVKGLEVIKIQTGSYPESLPSTISSNGIQYEKSAVTDSYCLTKASGTVNYFVTSKNKASIPGTCAGLVGWWPMNGNTKDMINEYDGVSTNGSTTAGYANVADTGWLLVGDSSPRFISTPLRFSPSTFTTSIWAKPDGNGPSPYGAIMSTARDCCEIAATTGMQLQYTRSTSALAVTLWTGGTNASAAFNVPNAITVGQWKHLVVTYDGSVIRLYTNGSEARNYTYAAPQSLPVSGYELKIGGGGWSTTGYTFGGSLDDARVYNRAITADEVSEMYNQGAQ